MKNKITMGLIVLMMGLMVCSSTSATVVKFSDFSDSSVLTLNGYAIITTTDEGIVLRLTPAEGNNSGSAFSSQTLNALKFSTFFKFRITNPGGEGEPWDCNAESGADGIVFVIQAVSSSIGGLGEGIGYSGISKSVGVEFDTWCNEVNNDPNSNHIGINVNGSVDHGEGSLYTTNIIPNFDNGNVWYAWIDYDGITLEARISQSPKRPEKPEVIRQLNISEILGQATAYVGFTSATGTDWGNHDIIAWEYRDTYDPVIINDNDCKLGDIDNDGKVGLTEAVYALQVTAGIKTELTSSSSCAFGNWEERNFDTVYKGESDGFVVTSILAHSGSSRVVIRGYTDSFQSPATLRAQAAATDKSDSGHWHVQHSSFTMPVKKGDYWKVETYLDQGGSTKTLYWISLDDGSSNGSNVDQGSYFAKPK